MAKRSKTRRRTASTRRAATGRKGTGRAATKYSARRTGTKTAKKKKRKTAKPEGLGARIVHVVDAVLDTLTDAERLHARTARKSLQELE